VDELPRAEWLIGTVVKINASLIQHSLWPAAALVDVAVIVGILVLGAMVASARQVPPPP
jgi:hypothetical protein